MKWILLSVLLILQSILVPAQNADWIQQSPPVTAYQLNDIAVLNSTTLIAVGANGTIIKSTDNGARWSIRQSGTSVILNSMHFFSASTGYVVGSEGKILKTTDGGDTWTSQNSGVTAGLYSLKFCTPDTGWVIGGSNTILKTTDGGKTWQTQYTAETFTYLQSIEVLDSKNIIVVGWGSGTSGEIHRSTNGGQTWTSTDLGNIWMKRVRFLNKNEGWAAGISFNKITITTDPFFGTSITIDGKKSTVWHTTDGGNTWTPKVFTTTTKWLYDVNFADSNKGCLVGETGLILNTTDGGTTWIAQNDPLLSSFTYNSIAWQSVNSGCIVGSAGSILKTDNSGVTWKLLGNGGSTNSLESVSFVNDSTGWAVGENETIIKTTNGGKYWKTQISGSYTSIESVFFINDSTGWISDLSGRIYKTSNGGQTWVQQTSGTSAFLYSIYFTNADAGWCVGYNGTILKTTNGGTTWSPYSSGYTDWFKTVFFTNAQNGWISSWNKILHTTDGGNTWKTTELGNSNGCNNVFFIDQNTGWYVGTAIYKTVDGGLTWTRQFGMDYYGYGQLTNLYFLNSNTGWVSGTKGKLLKTSDGGVTWSLQETGYEYEISDISFVNQSVGWITGKSGLVLKTTTGGGKITPMVNLPVPTLVSPIDWENNVELNRALKWRSTGTGSKYHVLAFTGNDTTVNQIITSDTSLTASLKPGKYYDWKVRVINDSGITGNWSSEGVFRTCSLPTSTLYLNSPYKYSYSKESVLLTLEWSGGANINYHIQVAKDSSFSQIVADKFLTVDSLNVSLEYSTKYYWHVVCINSCGAGNWSKTGIFTTQAKPYLSVSIPRSGYEWVLGLKNQIFWSSNIQGIAMILLYKGGNLIDTLGITDNKYSTSFLWNISNSYISGSDYQIMVKDTSSQISGISSNFSLESPYIKFNGPDANTSWIRGSKNKKIWWSSNVPDNLILLLYRGEYFIDTLAAITGYATSYYWDIPITLSSGDNYKVVIKNLNAGIETTSSFFKIVDPYITVTVPLSNSIWKRGSEMNIQWSANTPGAFKLYLYKGGELKRTIGTTSGEYIISYKWKIDSLLPAAEGYSVVVVDTGYTITGTSGFFSISESVMAVPGIPLLSSPANNVHGQSLNPGLVWSPPTDAETYAIQVSTASDFSSLVAEKSNFTITYYVPAGLTNGTKYYWRVRATNAAGTGTWSEVWNFTTVTAIPGIPLLSSPANNVPGQPLNLGLVWSPPTDAETYTIQVSTASDFSSLVAEKSNFTITYYVPAGLTNGTKYYWRVRATNAAGTGTWSEVWNFTTVPAIPGAPTLSSPANNSVNQPLSLSLAWNAANGAASYAIQVSTTSDFSTTIVNQSGLTSINYSPGGLVNGTKYYWRLNATNIGGTSAWSEIWNLTTISSISPPFVQASNLTISGITGNTATVRWTKGNGSRSVVFVKQGTDGTPEPADNTTYTANVVFGSGSQVGSSGWYCVYLGSDSTVSISNLASRTTFKVMAISLNGNAGDEKYLRQTAAGNPVTFATTCDFDYYGTNPEVHLYYKNATTFDVEITNSHSCGSTTLKFQNRTLTGNSFSITVNAYPNSGTMEGTMSADGNSFSGTYNISYAYLHPVYGYAVPCGTKSGSWSASRKSTGPAAPVLTSPENNVVDQPLALLLKWNLTEGADSYSLQVSKFADFSTVLISQNNIIGKEYTLSGLDNNTAYYWRVAAANDCYKSGWSVVWNFTTLQAIPETPVLVGPDNGSANQPVSFTLAWNAATRAEFYSLQVSTKSDFSSTVLDESNLTATIKTISGLLNKTVYYWRVRASNIAGAGNWSQVWNFTTVVPVGIVELFLNDHVRIYPNPATGKITVEFSQPVTGDAEIKLYEPSGRMMLAGKLVSVKSEIDVSCLTHGIYFAVIRTGTSVFNDKLVIF